MYQSQDATVRQIFAKLTENIYPAGSHYQKLARALIADEIIESRPNVFATRYHVPKWIIPFSSITNIKVISDAELTQFSIITDQKQYHFRADKAVASRWIELLENMGGGELMLMDKFPRRDESLHDEMKLYAFTSRQRKWRKVLNAFVKKQPGVNISNIVTVFSSPYGIQEVRGLRINHKYDDHALTKSLRLQDSNCSFDNETTSPASSMKIENSICSNSLYSKENNTFSTNSTPQDESCYQRSVSLHNEESVDSIDRYFDDVILLI